VKSIILHTTSTYPDVVAQVSTNGFGEQLVEIIKEYQDGRKECLRRLVNHEGFHLSDIEIHSKFRHLIKKGTTT
jgi:hypothetical protein